MKTNIFEKLINSLKSNTFLAISSGMLLMSCGVYTGGYSETDGVYYDPNTDTLPIAVVDDYGNQVGGYYDYQDNSPRIIQRGMQNQEIHNNRFRNDNWNNNAISSDWGNYAGSETNYNMWGSSWGMGMMSPWGWGMGYSPWGMGGFGMNYGWGMGMHFGLGMNFGWYSPWRMGMMSPWGMSYSPWGWGSSIYGMGMMSPWGWGMNHFYNPYGMYGGWGMGTPIYGHHYRTQIRRSGADGVYNNLLNTRPYVGQPNANARVGNAYRGPGVITNTPNSYPYQNQRMNNTNTQRIGNYPTYGRQPMQQGQAPIRQPQPRYESRGYENRSFQNRSYDGGFRSGGFNSGGGNNSSGMGGGMRTGGGGMRTGGGRF